MNALYIYLACIAYATGALIVHGIRNRRKAARKAAEQEQRAAAKAERERDRAAKAASKAQVPKRKRGRPRKEPGAPVCTSSPVSTAPESEPKPLQDGTKPFAGQSVAFTGTLTGMTRAEAIAAVQAADGKAFDTMPAGTTLLVVGRKPGMGKLDKADRWIGQVRKITEAQFVAMLNRKTPPKAIDEPKTYTLQTFADRYCA